MKKQDWARVRGTDFDSLHPLASKPLPDLIANSLSTEMVTVLRRIAGHERKGEMVDGDRLGGFSTKPSTIEALWFRALVKVRWRAVPLKAPMVVRVGQVSLTERGKAALAIMDLAREETRDVEFTAPPGVSAVTAFGVGGGGGGGNGSASGQAVFAVGPGGFGAASIPVTPGQRYGITVGAGGRGAAGKTSR